MKKLSIILSAAVMAFALWLLSVRVAPPVALMISLVACSAVLLGGLVIQRRRTALVGFANSVAEGIAETGRMSLLATAAIATTYLLGKRGADDQHVSVCGASDIPMWIIQDQAEAAEDPVTGYLLGCSGPSLVVAAGVIAANAQVYTAAGGQVQALPTDPGTYYLVGRVPHGAAAAGDKLLIAPCVATPVVVT